MKKVYVVSSSGCYGGDYRVNAIFLTKKSAEEFIKSVPDPDYNDIEEYELNPPIGRHSKRKGDEVKYGPASRYFK